MYMKSKRRAFIKNLGIASAGAAISPVLTSCKTTSNIDKNPSVSKVSLEVATALKKYSKKAKQLVKEATCIDMLGTYGDWAAERNGKSLDRYWGSTPNSFTKEDYEFVMSSGINVFGWGKTSPGFEVSVMFMAEQNGIIASNPDYFMRIDTKEKLKTVNNSGKIGMLITNQDSVCFEAGIGLVHLFYGYGQRVAQLTYNGENKLGCGAFVEVDTGLTAYGKQVIQEMNKIGMAVDVSHCGDRTTLEAIEASSSPVLITHGACRAIAKGVARAKTDEAIKAMAKTGGVIGIPILRFMISEKEPVSIEDYLNHIDHVVQLVGIEHVGIGSDQGLYTEDNWSKEMRKSRLESAPPKYQVHTNDEYLLSIEGLNHPYRTYDIAEGLIKRGYNDEHVKMVLGNNFQRALLEIFKD